MNPRQVLSMVAERKVKIVDLRFMDFPGLWQHVTIPADELDEAVFEDGKGFDGSSVRGWKATLRPRISSGFICRCTI